jgi:hypothetical protein
VIDRWRVQDHPSHVTGTEAVQVIQDRIRHGVLTTWFESDSGRVMAFVTNYSRAMVMLLDEPGDPGEHAIDPAASGEQEGYVLENGQHDTYANRDTVPLDLGLTLVEHIVDHGRPPSSAAWEIDR